jgi:hypothetical protein
MDRIQEKKEIRQEGNVAGLCLDDGVGHRGQALVVGLYDYCEATCIRAHQRGKVRDQVDGREIVGVRDFQRLQEAAQSIVAEAQGFGCRVTTHKRPLGFLPCLLLHFLGCCITSMMGCEKENMSHLVVEMHTHAHTAGVNTTCPICVCQKHAVSVR